MAKVKRPQDLAEDAGEARTLMVPFAIRDTVKGYFVTGFTHGKMILSVDLCGVMERYILGVFDRNPGRALRIVDHLRGKRMGLFPWRHRTQLKEDIAELAGKLKRGGYSAE